ncbi:MULTISPECIES: hypothetical protein [Pseudoalteromonas]|uniref:hypothetical protein n=1 Tax=Pseudoalteromonas TaxID=53246 RepID=UPI000C67BA85|nr:MULTISPECIES: hypothetical protein [Pseudoalteromonas]MAY59652.1 hypothetical protein [Pseudoalteromonas sp.]MDN3407841.1 hypothetical protein [Pseudoalteromonas sp. APC 3894]MDN3415481.1 hypothetical protein [Pseudoalteromonas sp. APC 3227]MDN3419059.1 hypothetical protein [Pseudoalteromonas sp. APC 3895]MDN3422548.1 hypothetical protein [Pseudoalteromonas sp. APC 3896]
MNYKQMSWYLLLVVLVAILAFALDVFSSRLTVDIGPKSILDKSGQVTTSLEVLYPLWHQIVNLLKNFLYGLAAAIFITVFVANRLENSQRKEKEDELKKLNDAINVNVFDSLFKTIIPEEIFKIIKQEIIENKVVRRDAKWVYNFIEDNGKIICTQTTRYELHNLSQAPVSDPVKLELDTLGGEEYKIVSAECTDTSGTVLVHYDPEDSTNSKNIDVKSNGNVTTVAYTVNIPPESYVEYKTVFKRAYTGDITDAQATKVPVIGADIIVNFPEGYDFDISPLMSSFPRLITQSSTQKIYKVEGGILPRQGFIFYLINKANNSKHSDAT